MTLRRPSRPRVLTARLIVLSAVSLLALVLLLPTVRAAIDQHHRLEDLRSRLAAGEAEADRLAGEIVRFDDPAYIEGQARSRLSYAMPGDRVWRTVGGELLTEDVDPMSGRQVGAGIVGVSSETTWYEALLESVRVADGPAPIDDEPEPELREVPTLGDVARN